LRGSFSGAHRYSSIIVSIHRRAANEFKRPYQLEAVVVYDIHDHQTNTIRRIQGSQRKAQLVLIKNIRPKKDYCLERTFFREFAKTQEKTSAPSNYRGISIK